MLKWLLSMIFSLILLVVFLWCVSSLFLVVCIVLGVDWLLMMFSVVR